MTGISPDIIAGGVGILALKEAIIFIKWAVDKIRPENGKEERIPYQVIDTKLNSIVCSISTGKTERSIIQTKLENIINMVEKQNGDLKRTVQKVTRLEALIEKNVK